jgi:anti-sigma factor RsiW
MTGTELRDGWAWAHVEAMADGSLDAVQADRMRDAMTADPSLAAAVARARELRLALVSLPPQALPRGLLTRLMRIPQERNGAARRSTWLKVAGPAFALSVAAAVAVLVMRPAPQETPDPEAAAAIAEFAVAMSYLQQTAVTTQDAINEQLRNGLQNAFEESRRTLFEDSNTENGG